MSVSRRPVLRRVGARTNLADGAWRRAGDPPMATRFTNCKYGPMHVRSVLREKLAHGERIVAWGVVQRSAPNNLKVAAAAIASPVGLVLMSTLHQRSHRFVVLTDCRLLVFKANARPPLTAEYALVADAPLGLLRVRAVRIDGPFDVALDDEDPPQRLDVLARSRAALRLRIALRELAAME